MSVTRNRGTRAGSTGAGVAIHYQITADDQVRAVLEAAARKFCNEDGCAVRWAIVTPLERFGHSGAALFRLQTDRSQHVIKIAKTAKIQAEHTLHTRACVHLRVDACLHYEDDSGLAALLYILHIGARGADLPPAQTLKEKIDASIDACMMMALSYQHERDIESYCHIIQDALGVIGTTKNRLHKVEGDKPYRNIYEATNARSTYFRKEKHVVGILRSIWNAAKRDSALRHFGVADPLTALRTVCERTPRKRLCRVTHGDFHGSNILVTGKKRVALIDFAWLDPCMDFLVDHIMLENSLRFMASPLARLSSISRKVSKEYVTQLVPNRPWKGMGSSAIQRAYELVCTLVNQVRWDAWRRAKAEDSTLGPQEFLRLYLEAQLIVLTGQMQYRDYDRVGGVEYLGMIAHALNKG